MHNRGWDTMRQVCTLQYAAFAEPTVHSVRHALSAVHHTDFFSFVNITERACSFAVWSTFARDRRAYSHILDLVHILVYGLLHTLM